MPIRFPCEHCDRVLKVSSSKIGRSGKCPNCQGPIKVPQAEAALSLMKKRKEAAPPRDETEPAEEEFDPFAEFVVYDDADDGDDYYYESNAGYAPAADSRTLDPTRLAVSRSVIYMQGALLGIVALICFTLGAVVGGLFAPRPIDEEEIKGPFFVSGEVRFNPDNRTTSFDDGAVVVVLPKDAAPERKVSSEGLRARDDVEFDPTDQLRPLLEAGGVYTRVDMQGHYSVKVLSPGKYLVLVISRRGSRPEDRQMPLSDVAIIGKYFNDAYEFVGDRQYELVEQTIRRDQHHDVVFKAGA